MVFVFEFIRNGETMDRSIRTQLEEEFNQMREAVNAFGRWLLPMNRCTLPI
jgi:hypothetical protein